MKTPEELITEFSNAINQHVDTSLASYQNSESPRTIENLDHFITKEGKELSKKLGDSFAKQCMNP